MNLGLNERSYPMSIPKTAEQKKISLLTKASQAKASLAEKLTYI